MLSRGRELKINLKLCLRTIKFTQNILDRRRKISSTFESDLISLLPIIPQILIPLKLKLRTSMTVVDTDAGGSLKYGRALTMFARSPDGRVAYQFRHCSPPVVGTWGAGRCGPIMLPAPQRTK